MTYCDRPLTGALLLALALSVLPTSAPPSANTNPDAKLVIHLTSPTRSGCALSTNPPPCSAVVSQGTLYPAGYYAYVLVADASAVAGVAGISFGITYNAAQHAGVDVFGWTNCATLQFAEPGWPAANTGNLVTWNRDTVCQRLEPGGPGTGVVAVVGYFYASAYSPDDLKIIRRPYGGDSVVGDCDAVETVIPLSSLGYARFSAGGTEPGYNPCLGVVPPPGTCQISGPTSVPAGSTGNAFSATTSEPATSWLWTITGNGTISGSNTGPTVLVDAGSTGSFNLTLAFQTATGNSGQCASTVTIEVAPTPTCSVTGPTAVYSGSTGNMFWVTTSEPATTWLWTLTGNGTISGSNTGSSVLVDAGPSGSFNLTVTFHLADGRIGQCARTITILVPPECTISGPTTVPAYSTGNIYQVTTNQPAGSYYWQISGSGTIAGSVYASAVSVTAGASGSFELSVTFTSAGGNGQCTLAVTLGPPVECVPCGPDNLYPYQYATYTAPLALAYHWSIAGNGVLAGPADGPSVQVQAGSSGTMTLSVRLTRSSGEEFYSKTIYILPAPPTGGPNANAKIAVHLQAQWQPDLCAAGPPRCSQVVTHGSLFPQKYFAFVLVEDGNAAAGIAGLQFGIQYDGAPHSGVDIFEWHLCATLEFITPANPPWPYTGTGNLITWETNTRCQRYEPGGAGTGVMAIAGYFYMTAYSPDLLVITPRPVDGLAKVASCAAEESLVDPTRHLGSAGFSNDTGFRGYNPCGMVTPTMPTTWSRIKTMYD